jgi:hypothetical protein
MSNTATMTNQKIPINRVSAADMLITDERSAIESSMDSFNNYQADYSMTQDDPELSRNPNAPAQEKPKFTKSHGDSLNSDVANLSTTQEPLTESTSDHIEPVAQQVAQTQPANKPETNREYNMRVLREKAEVAEAENRHMKAMMANNAYQNQYQQPQQQRQSQPEPIEELKIDDDALIEGKQLKQYINNLKQEFKRELQGIKAQSAEASAETRLKMQFNDFGQVVNAENVKNFAAVYPEEYRTAMSSPDIYGQAVTLYRLIKGQEMDKIHTPQQPERRSYSEEDRRIEENLKKPRTAAKVGTYADTSTLGRLNEYSSGGRRMLTEADKAKVRERLDNSRRYSY